MFSVFRSPAYRHLSDHSLQDAHHSAPAAESVPSRASSNSAAESAEREPKPDYRQLLKDLESESRDHVIRAQFMRSLADQIASLPQDKSAVDKGREAGTRTLAALGRAVWLKSSASQKQLRHNFATPQAEVFNGLMRGLANPNRLTQSVVVGQLGALKRTEHRPLQTPFHWKDLERRRVNAPVWEKLIFDAPNLKPERQSKMLDLFETNFNDIPETASEPNQEAKAAMIAAYENSLVGLANSFSHLGKPAGPDGWNEQQTKAAAILEKWAPMLPHDALNRVKFALGEPAFRFQNRSPSSERLNALATRLDSAPAAQTQRVQPMPNTLKPDLAKASQEPDRNTLIARIEKPAGDLDRWASDMLDLARKLPHLSATKSKSARIFGKSQQILHGTSPLMLLPGRFPNEVMTNSRLRHSVETTRRSPQGLTFEFLMNHLDDPRARTKLDLDFRGNFVPPKRVLKFNPNDIDRRIAAAPVWQELISQAGNLKQERQVKLVERFRENLDVFKLLPDEEASHWGEEKQAMLDAFSGSLVELAKVFSDLVGREKIDLMTPAQFEALALLREYGPMLQPGPQKAMVDEISRITDTFANGSQAHHPAILDLRALGKNLSNPQQANSNDRTLPSPASRPADSAG